MSNTKRKCKHCKEYFLVESMVKLGSYTFCRMSHGVEFAAKKGKAANDRKLNKLKRDNQKAQRAYFRAKKLEQETLPQLKKKAQAACNSYIRARDHGKQCISCIKVLGDQSHTLGGKFDAGHYRSVGAANHLRFNLLNIHGQCKHCNNYLDGNIVQYRPRLIQKIGADLVDKIECNNDTIKHDREWLRRFTKLMKRREKHYKNRRFGVQ